MLKEDLVQISMELIQLSGEARISVQKALDALSLEDEAETKALLHSAYKQINRAHQIHADLIQKEAAGEMIPYTPLFSHAQDALMTIFSEYNIAKQLASIFSVLDSRLKNLEQQN
ncbi:MAG: PTS lactose/cellobiose transporter subunit IIA [Erysipelotrichaceae bacterium]|jgi:PTS system cellobiose-specific IIA component|nr:PTS lactose/cellobiose transporter subunit IIA [Erysipelotrichaceae bacterium]